MIELRCLYKKHAELLDEAIEVRCRRPECGHRAGVVVIHRFDKDNGKLLETRRFRDPGPEVLKGGVS